MRYFFLITVSLFCCGNSIAQRQTREEVVKWLQANLSQQNTGSNVNNRRVNFTQMCVNFNLLPVAQTDRDTDNPKNFQDKILSNVSWKQDELCIQNNIFIKGKLKETYVYRVPASAIVDAKVTNCQKNVTEDVNAYVNRPIFICAKKNTVKITRQIFDNYGKTANSKSQQSYMNSKDADWDSIIPIAGNWDKNSALQSKVIAALTRLAELNDKKYTLN